jgi:hypothetical protein
MTTQTNVEKLGIVSRSVKSCCRGCSLFSLKAGIVSASVLLWANAGQAQVVVAPFPAGGYWGGVGTAESSAEHGVADIIRSEGYYNLTTAQGMVHAEQARALHLQNRQEAYRAYNAGKEQKQALEAQKRERTRHSAEALKAVGKSDAAQPLGVEYLNPHTGKINWPKTLLDSKFASQRTELEKLFELRARTSSGLNSQTKIQSATGELASLLKSNITRIPATDYIKAKKFLDSLAATASQS